MIAAIDTNILIDIFIADKQFGSASAEALKTCLLEGAVHACSIVWTEIATAFDDENLFLAAMQDLNIEFTELNQQAALNAAKSWQQYRKAGGKRDRIAADFLIGAHALIQCDRLLTRDGDFYRKYFQDLEIINPTPSSKL